MNAIKRIKNMQNIISELGGDFISLIEDNQVVIKDTNNNMIWQIPYSESEGLIAFDGTKAIKLQGSTRKKSDPIILNTKRLYNGINNLFAEDNETAIDQLKSIIRSLPYIQEDEIQSGITPQQPAKVAPPVGSDGTKCNEKGVNGEPCTGTITAGRCSNPNCATNATNQPVIKPGEVNAVGSGTQKMEELFKDFANASYLFTENGEINPNATITAFTTISKAELMSETNNYLIQINKYKTIKNKINSLLEEKIVSEIFDSLVWTESDLDTALARALATTKVKYKELNILETRKIIKETLSSVFEEVDMSKAAPWTYNLTTPNAMDEKNKPPFLKFRTGAFTYEAVKIMSQELDSALASKDLIPEELERLGNYRMIIEYMIQSKQINDHVLMAMIEEFNKMFVKSDDDYKDSPLGWRNRDEQMQGWTKGFARSIDTNLTPKEIEG